ncbi:3-dehydroquinate synthase [Streptomyces sp. NBC_01142]|uniref:3-dehydroquinate synthase family protein n=1 Tax=Streptomyces sp. NBC_01142 TaxID=2975865 RepID=UPI002254C9EE|nr:3-dehydroquinate synthase family protein [Streptomyces sp. NBC_01142]MCX4827069.1 3-dehydroquinate synthase [Streptomyces sp. NBC_01142]
MSTASSSSRLAVDASDNIFTVTAHRADTYRIHLAEGLATDGLSDRLGSLAAQLAAPEIVIVIDTGAAEHHLGAITAAVVSTGLRFRTVPVPAGEHSKSPDGLSNLIRALHQHGATRRTLLLGVGGGVVCDLVTAAAALYMRGMPYALVPTTVLAQVDAAIGGKGGIDYGAAKNLLGAFHHPAGVYIDPALTSTLPDRHIRAGLAEVIKVALIINPQLFATLERTANPLPDGQALTGIVRDAIAAKLLLLAPDPFEQKDLRRLLNLGHCVGHPYEAATGYRILHGEAVAAGTAIAAAHAYLTGETELEDRDRVLGLLAAYQLPLTIPDEMRDAVWDGIATVRRIRNGPLHLVLPHHPGHCTITDDIDRPAFDKALNDLAARP